MIKEMIFSSAHKVVEISGSISTSATKLSKLMDVSGGGYKAYGGYHRIFGGHDAWNLDMWSNYGTEYSRELLKDFITPNGLPLPGAKELVEKFGVSMQTAQVWGCINIGEFLGGSVSIFDSVKKIKKYRDNPEDEIEQKELLSLILKCTIATSTTNPIMAVSALSDASILMKKLYDQSFLGLFDYEPNLVGEY